MTKAKIVIGGKPVELVASMWTWICYKNIFKRDWNADRSKSIAELGKAAAASKRINERFMSVQTKYATGGVFEFSELDTSRQARYLEEIDAEFGKMPQDEQDAYWDTLNSNSVDLEFAINTMYAMAVAGGFEGAQKDLFENMSPAELNPDSELMVAFAALSEEFNIGVKKK